MSRRKALSIAGLSGTAALAAAVSGAVWYYMERLTEPPVDATVGPPDPMDVATVLEVDGDRIRLEGPGVDRPGRWGLDTASGYGQVGPPLETLLETPAQTSVEAPAETPTEAPEPNRAVRTLELMTGRIEPGQTALFDAVAWPPVADVVIDRLVQVVYHTPLGPAPAWFLPGESRTWLIVVHGRGGERHEGLRMIDAVSELGVPVLSIAYRNDGEGPRSPDNRSHLGAQEWQDVEAAIRHARANGAEDVVLAGFSMGGACVTAAVRLSKDADRVRGLILEAPVLDWGPVVRRAAIARGLPKAVLPALLPATMALARARVGIDWDQLRPDPNALDLPILLIHGTEDETVPVELSDALADARPDVTTYVRVPGAGHVRCWNADPDLYAQAVREFLQRLQVTAASA